MPKFSGSYVQGPSDNKFVYIDIGTYAGQTDNIWSSRLNQKNMSSLTSAAHFYNYK